MLCETEIECLQDLIELTEEILNKLKKFENRDYSIQVNSVAALSGILLLLLIIFVLFHIFKVTWQARTEIQLNNLGDDRLLNDQPDAWQ